jgi:hypothetical protein
MLNGSCSFYYTPTCQQSDTTFYPARLQEAEPTTNSRLIEGYLHGSKQIPEVAERGA